MKYPKERFLFTVKDLVRACGISRATLLRMEEDGFLKPYFIDSQTGYRYYDADNITQVGQYQLMRDLGLSRKEIADYYYKRSDTKDFLEKQRLRLNRLQRLLEELELRYDHSKDYSCSYIELPEITCFCVPFNGSRPEEQEAFAYDSYQKMIREGIKVVGSEPFFLQIPLRSAAASADTSETPNTPLLCFPIIPPDHPDIRIRTFPACSAFSMVVHGNYDRLSDFTERFQEEIIKRDLTPTGPVRAIALVAPYVGEHYSAEDYCGQFAVPVKKPL